MSRKTAPPECEYRKLHGNVNQGFHDLHEFGAHREVINRRIIGHLPDGIAGKILIAQWQ
ncbi:hypothetical protein OH491_27955 (plasmid) [Termitidicoccus mucosus]|uniref:hypothetical protein n=1 Tax=Termitidicoccus mucosus TaxID=1184151 RepID=UPI003183A317